MLEKQTYADQMMRMVKERQNQDETNYFDHENHIEDGYIIIQYAKIILEKRSLMDGFLTMICPESYEIMTEEVAKVKYPEEERPKFIYCNEKTTVSFHFSIEEEQVKDEEIEELKDILKRQIMRLYSIEKLDMDEMLKTKEGKQIGLFAMEIPVIDGTSYQITYFMSTNKGLLIGGFNCDADEKKEWRPVVKQMLSTIQETE